MTNERPSFPDVAHELAQPIVRYLERYVGDRAVAEDLQQETLIRMQKGFTSFAGRSSIKTWAFAIASRVAADHFRHPDRRTHIVEVDEVVDLADPDRAVDERMVADEMNACVRQVIDSLPEPYRAVLILRDLEGFTLEQTAEISGSAVAAVKVRLHRARLRLKKSLENECKLYHAPDGVLRCDRKD